MSSIASWADFFGLNPYEFSQKSASNTGSMTNFTAICATLSRIGWYPKWTFCPVFLGYHYPLYRACLIGLAFERFFQLRQKGRYPFLLLNGLKSNAVYPGAPFIGS